MIHRSKPSKGPAQVQLKRRLPGRHLNSNVKRTDYNQITD